MEDEEKDPYQGVKIQKLPTYGKPLSYKTRKQRGYYDDTGLALNTKKGQKLLKIAKILAKK